MKKIILLGGSGFLGRSLSNKLKENFLVKTMIHSNNVNIKTEKFNGDILSISSIEKGISKGDIIVNFVGQYSGSISDFIDLNITGGLNLLNSCVKKKVKRIILISTINVYGENMSYPSKETDMSITQDPYGVVKFTTEKIYEYYSKVFGLDVTILRLSHIYGPDKKIGIISVLLNSAVKNKSYTLFNNGQQLRDFLYVDDASDGIIQSIKLQQKGFHIFNISSSVRYSLNNVVKTIEEISNKKMKIHLNPTIPDEKCIWANNSKAKRILKFKPKVDLKQGLKITYEYIQNQINQS